MHFSGIVLILISMTLINTFFSVTIVEATPFRYCNPRNCAKECQGRGKGTGYCDEDVCKCSGWKR
uniref:Putative potassium channel toxin n=1 Tax=Tityus obscurus TaxID=1221240 RepID=A0A1E1WVZ4_TITOB